MRGCRLALAGLLAATAWLLMAADQTAPPRLLKVHSRGYSRFEIDPAGNVVEFQTEGVECEYMGQTVKAFELRYNHATQVVTASGGVEYGTDGLTLTCQSAILDGMAGTATVDCPLSGALTESGVVFTAGSARLAFPPGAQQLSQEDVTAYFEDGVTACDAAGRTLVTTRIVYAGAAGQVTAPEPVTLDDTLRTVRAAGMSYRPTTRQFELVGPITVNGDFSNLIPPEQAADYDLSEVVFEAQGISGELSETNRLSRLELREMVLSASQLSASAAELILEADPEEPTGARSFHVTGSGDPIRGTLIMAEREVSFAARSLLGSLDQDGLTSLALERDVRVSSPESTLETERLAITRGPEGFSLVFPDGLVLGLNLAELTGTEPVDFGLAILGGGAE